MQQEVRPPVLVLGLGNPLRGDDGVGWRVVEDARPILEGFPSNDADCGPGVEVDCLDLGGLALMERMVGYDRVVLVDAMHVGTAPVGAVGRLWLSDLPDPPAGHLTSAHDTSLANALELGRRLGVPLPSAVAVVGVEAQEVYEFSEQLSPPVAAAVPAAVKVLLQTVSSMTGQ